MTDVERTSTARTSRSTRPLLRVTGLVWSVVTALSIALLPAAHPAGADPLADAKAQAAQLSAQIAADGAKLDALAQQYDQAQQQLQSLTSQLAGIQTSIDQARLQVQGDQSALRQVAVTAYMQGSTDTGLESVFNAGGTAASTAQVYRNVASGNLQSAVDHLHHAQTTLAAQQSLLQTTQHAAQQAVDTAAQAQQQAQATQQAEQAALARVNGQIKSLVAAQQAAADAAAQQAFLARVTQAQQQATQTFTSATAPPASVPAAGGAARAVQAAQSQLGVPYQWGGESPGVGFDCSGLTQWAWGQAGVSIPRTAAGQYAAITHVPMSDIQPGDLVFWAEGGTISHVGIYVGNGEVIHAPSTGETVRYQAIWSSGLVGAGRP